MNILILGGTQFLGKHLLEECLLRNHKVTTFNRGMTDIYIYDNSVEKLYGNRELNDYSQLSNRKWDVVIDVPSFKPDIVKGAFDFLYNHTNMYVFISTMSVYDIDKSYDKLYNEYCKDKAEAEKIFLNKNKSLILRPGILCGDGDNTQRFDYKSDGIFWKNTYNQVSSYVMVDDYADFVLNLIEENRRGTYEEIKM